MMALCAPFEQSPTLAVAVSGGSDSMALLRLAQDWARGRAGQVVALTVDHGLRAEAAAEAGQVKAWCAELGIAHHTLCWQPPQGRQSLQEKAREGRYALLSAWCRAQHVLHLLCAHTQDDQCETLFFRLARGSQMEGLASMPLVSEMGGVRLLRPLLHSRKAALQATLAGYGQGWAEDASNQKPVYTRNHIRLQLVEPAADAAFMARVTQAADRFADIRNNLFFNNVSYLTEAVSLYAEGYAVLDRDVLARLPQEAGVRLLAALIPALNGVYHPPRAEALARLRERVAAGGKCTMGGLVFAPSRLGVLVAREKAALPEARTLHGAWQGPWDGRFAISFDAGGDVRDFTLKPLGKTGIDALSKRIPIPESQRVLPALRALPSLWHLDELVAAPHMAYRHVAFGKLCFGAMFCSAKPLAGSPFFGFNSI